MNTMDVEEAADLFLNHPVLGPASKFLLDFKDDVINANSDGWPYWEYGVRCSKDLQKLLQNEMAERYRSVRQSPKPTRADVEKACAKITEFVTNEPQLAGVKPPVLATAVQLTF